MTPQIDNPMQVRGIETLPSKTYKLNVDAINKIRDQELEYIESDGHQMIRVGLLLPETRGIIIEMGMCFPNITYPNNQTKFLLGTNNINKTGVQLSYKAQGTNQLYLGIHIFDMQTTYSQTRTDIDKIYSLKFNLTRAVTVGNQKKRSCYVSQNESTIISNNNIVNPNIFPSTDDIYLFNVVNASNPFAMFDYASSIRMYYCKIYDENTNRLMRDFVPYMHNGEACLYDKITRAYFTNATYSGSKPFKYKLTKDNFTDTISGYVDNKEAMKQAIYHILMTERYAYLIYTDNYGVELEQYIGADFNYIKTTIESTLKDALLYDLRIKDVHVTNVTQVNTDAVLVKFTANTIYGDLQLEVNISV